MRHVNSVVLSTSDATSQNGSQIDTNQIIAASFQAVFSDTDAAGSVKIQMSNDINHDSYQPAIFTVVNWTDVPNTSTSVTAGGSIVITIPQSCYRWLRAVYTSTTPGTGVVSVQYNGLSI